MTLLHSIESRPGLNVGIFVSIVISWSALYSDLPQHATGREDLERIAQVKHLAAFLYLNERLEDKPRGMLRKRLFQAKKSCANI
jgi:hypothetical protein